ncbi:MAG TPA: hypothetical protein VGE99_13430 [Candidatus Dormibacteraeota bacterium]
MSRVDAAWLGMEDPTNLMRVTGLLALDSTADQERLVDGFEKELKSLRTRADV